jgi:Cd2+/Zn2+-exporting ATPase
LTKGVPEVTDIVNLSGYAEDKVIQMAGILESRSQHPLASAIMKKAESEGVDLASDVMDEFQSITGKGIKGSIEGNVYYAGSLSLFTEDLNLNLSRETIQEIDHMRSEGKTVLAVGSEEELIAIIAVADTIRKESANVVKALHSLGIKNTIMLTGDHKRTAESIAKQMNISTVKAELLPEEKLNYIKEYEKRYGKVAMIGDGVNDAPALAASTVGIAMGGAGTDTAIETADIALMGDDLRKLPYAIKLSRKTLNIIKQNISFALGIKLLALLLVIPGWLTLWIAIFADMGATLLVTLNSLRLLRLKD